MKELLPVVIALACPLMMLLMMRGHRHGGAPRGGVSDRDPAPTVRIRYPRGVSSKESQ